MMSDARGMRALIFDIGQHSLRAGYSDDLLPKYDIPGSVGVLDPERLPLELLVQRMKVRFERLPKEYYVDTYYLHVPKVGMEVQKYMKKGVIQDWDLFEKILDYTYAKCLRIDSSAYPLLISESAWNTRKNRERITEIMFEKYSVPAYYLARNAALTAISYGKSTALVVDSGAAGTRAVPVVDGYVRTRAIRKSPLGGDYMTKLCRQLIEQDNNLEIILPYMIASKEVVREREEACWIKKDDLPNVTHSWHNYMTEKVVEDFQSTLLQLAEVPLKRNIDFTYPALSYEFPNGYNQSFDRERFLIPEALFDPSWAGKDRMTRNWIKDEKLSVGNIALTSIYKCHPTFRAFLFKNVIVTGGNSLVKGFPQRLYQELSEQVPYHVKVHSAASPFRRRFSAWMGGSVLTSTNTFQRLWISRQEYEEGGKGRVLGQCL